MVDGRKALNESFGKGAEALDITPTMLKEAIAHYGTIAEFLQNNGIQADFYPYGSIATGTVIRPWSKDDDAYFDIDTICKRTDADKNRSNPSDIRQPIEDALLGSGRYGSEMVDIFPECITVNYVQNGTEGGFRLDLAPCVENPLPDPDAAKCSGHPAYANETVSIAVKDQDEWLGSNPKGLIAWFKDKNERFASVSREQQRTALFEKNSKIYGKVEDVPSELERSSLQRAVQIAKRSRDVYYSEFENAEKPSSCMIMVLMAEISDVLPANSDPIDILEEFCKTIITAKKDASEGKPTIIGCSGNWQVENPVYEGGFLDDWSDNYANRFFKWVSALYDEIIEPLEHIQLRQASLENIFGKRIAKTISPDAAAPAIIAGATGTRGGYKPWRAC